MKVYLDFNATAPLRECARTAMLAAWEMPGNTSSVHWAGRAAHAALEDARTRLARHVGCAPNDLIFTSGGTESNNSAIRNAVQVLGCSHILLGSGEHPSVREAANAADVPVKEIPVHQNGMIDMPALKELLTETEKSLVAVMLANNETGVIQPIAEIAAMVEAAGGVLHVDAVQALGKIQLNFGRLGAHSMAIAAHKVGGPLGVGALIMRCGTDFQASQIGGGHEQGRRAGTVNVPGICGFADAMDEAVAELPQFTELAGKRDKLAAQMREHALDMVVFSEDAQRLSNTLCCAAPGFSAQSQLMAMDLDGYAISSGSACSSGKVATSRVLESMGIDPHLSSCAIRVSFGVHTKDAELDGFATSWGRAYARTMAMEKAG